MLLHFVALYIIKFPILVKTSPSLRACWRREPKASPNFLINNVYTETPRVTLSLCVNICLFSQVKFAIVLCSLIAACRSSIYYINTLRAQIYIRLYIYIAKYARRNSIRCVADVGASTNSLWSRWSI